MKKFYFLVLMIVLMAAALTFWQYSNNGDLEITEADKGEGQSAEVVSNLTLLEEKILEKETHVPIIMYHYVRELNKEADPLGWNLSINPEDFEKQLAWLKEKGYETVHLRDLIDGKVPEKSLVLTFDDGLEDFYTTALPLLKKYGFTASNAVVTGMIGAHEHMTNEQIKELVAAGIELTAHTVGHLDLSKMEEEGVRAQVLDSKNYLEKEFGVKIDGFVYPSGKYNDLVVKVLEQEGYKIAVTTEYGEADLVEDKMLLLPRVRIDNRDGFEGFVRKMEALGNFY